MNGLSEKEFLDALKIHGYCQIESDSDMSEKSDFDEAYQKAKPPPVDIDSKKIIVIKAAANQNDDVSHLKSKKFRNENYQIRNAGGGAIARPRKIRSAKEREEKPKQFNKPRALSASIKTQKEQIDNLLINSKLRQQSNGIVQNQFKNSNNTNIFETESFTSKHLILPPSRQEWWKVPNNDQLNLDSKTSKSTSSEDLMLPRPVQQQQVKITKTRECNIEIHQPLSLNRDSVEEQHSEVTRNHQQVQSDLQETEEADTCCSCCIC